MRSMNGPRRVRLGLLSAMSLSFSDTMELIDEAVRDTGGPTLVAPVNSTMLHVARTEPLLVQAVSAATIVPCDGGPIVWCVRRVVGSRRAERVTGADLLPRIVSERPYKVLFVGGRGDAGSVARERLLARGATAEFLAPENVPFGELADEKSREALVSRIVGSGADIIFVGLGIPKQEMLVLACMSLAPRGVFICCGAAIDFIAGVQKRAPVWMRVIGLEWAWRIATDPRRLGLRYVFAVPELLAAMLEVLGRRDHQSGQA